MILDYSLFSINTSFMKRYEVNIEETVVETFSFELPDDVDIYDYVQENYYNCNIVRRMSV